MGDFSSTLLYLSTYLLSAILLHFAAKASSKGWRNFLFLLALLPPCLLAGLRYLVGTDYMNYYYMFQSFADMPLRSFLKPDQFDMPGVYLISKAANIFHSSELYFFIFAVVIYAPMAWRIMEKKDDEPVAALAFMFLIGSFTSGMNVMRQTAAASICFFSLKYVYDRKFLKYAITILLATAFHTTAIIFLPVYYIWGSRKKFSLRSLWIWLIIVAYAVVALNFSKLIVLLGEKYEVYSEENVQGANLSLVLDFIWLVVFFLFYKPIIKQDKKSGLLFVMMLIGNVLGLTGLQNTYVKRIGSYFSYPGFLLRAQLRYGFTKKSQGVVVALMILYSIAIFIITYLLLGQAEIIPYQSTFGV